MTTEVQIFQPIQRIAAERTDDPINFLIYEDDNTIIKSGGFEYEITKDNAIRLANIIIESYK